MPICKICGEDSFWTVDIASKICSECDEKKNRGIEDDEIRREKEQSSQKKLEEEKSETTQPEPSTTKPEALKKLKEAKEHLELELITQDDYDKLKNELSPIIMSSSDEKSETTQSESKKMSNWVYIAIVVCIFWLIGVMMPPTNSSSRTNVTYKYYCDECGDGISEQPYQCIFYKCTKARTVASGLDTFCSCSCGVEHMRRDGFQYTCN